MSKIQTSINYFLSDWFDNRKAKSVVFYRADQPGRVKVVVKNRWNKVIQSKEMVLIGQDQPTSQLWWGYTSPLGLVDYASEDEIEAYFKRRKKGRQHRKSTKLPKYIDLKAVSKHGLATKKGLFGG